MSAATRMPGLLAARRPDFSLQREFYTDPELYALEVDEIWHKSWIFVGLACEVAEPGRWMKVDIAGESAIVLRGLIDAGDETLKPQQGHDCPVAGVAGTRG